MKKIIVGLLFSFLVVALTTTVSAKESKVNSQKVDIYHVSGGSSDNVLLDQPYKGHVTVVNPMGANGVVINGVIKGLLLSREYFVWVRDLTGYTGPSLFSYAPLGYYKLTSFVTDENGNGNFHYKISTADLTAGEYKFQLAINDETGSSNQIGHTVAATQKYLTVVVN